MSIAAISTAWKFSKASSGELIVLLSLADHADGDGVCWPSVESLAGKSRLKKRQVLRVLDSLIERGEIEVWKFRWEKKGPENNCYRIVLGDFATNKGVPPQCVLDDQRKNLVGRKITPSLRAEVFETLGYRCLACASTERLHVDHIVPWSVGGLCEFDNLQPLCGPCNHKKSTRTLDFRGCQNDTDREAVWSGSQVTSITPAEVTQMTPPAQAILSGNRHEEPSLEEPNGSSLDIPSIFITSEGKNEPLDALAEVCHVTPKSKRMVQVALALNGAKGKPQDGIRAMYWGELCDWANETGNHAKLREMQAHPEIFADRLAKSIRRRGAIQQERMPVAFGPQKFRDWFLDIDAMPEPSKRANASQADAEATIAKAKGFDWGGLA